MNTASDPPSTVFVIDDEQEVRTLLECILKRAGYRIETFSSASAFLKRPCFEGSGCLVLDVQMPDMDGIELQTELARTGKKMPIIFLTGHGDIRTSVHAMKQGAIDFLSKPFKREELLTAVSSALEIHRQWRKSSAETDEVRKRIATLTPRETDVLQGVIAGKLNKQIAAKLGVREITVKVHRRRVMEKMGVSSVAELVRITERGHLSTNA